MLSLRKRWLVALSAGCLVIGMANAQEGLNSEGESVETDIPVDGVAEQIRLDQMAMKQVLKSQEMMTKAKEQLMGDDDVALRVAREILMQEMVKDAEYLAMMREGLRADADSEPKLKEFVSKISAAKAELLKDQDAMMSMTQELMIRQLAANRIAMMNGGRLDSEEIERLEDVNPTR